jgi:O-antigen ligase
MIIMNLYRGDLSPFLRKCLWGTIAASAVAALLSYSRHALLAMLISGFFYFVLAKRGRIKALLLGIVILVGGLQIVSVDFWQERVGKGGVTTDSNLRARLIDRPKELVDRIVQDPLVVVLGAGLGLKRLEDMDREEKREAQYGFASNGFLLYLFNTGIAAFAVVLALYGRALVRAFKVADDGRAVALAGVLCAASVVASDNYAFVIPNIPFMTSLILASVIVRSGQPALHKLSASQRIRGGFLLPVVRRSFTPNACRSLTASLRPYRRDR